MSSNRYRQRQAEENDVARVLRLDSRKKSEVQHLPNVLLQKMWLAGCFFIEKEKGASKPLFNAYGNSYLTFHKRTLHSFQIKNLYQILIISISIFYFYKCSF